MSSASDEVLQKDEVLQTNMETEESQVTKPDDPADSEERVEAQTPAVTPDTPAKCYAEADQKEQRDRLIYSIKCMYPILDKCMCEAAVDMFLKYPDLMPDEILKDVPSSYFLDNMPVVTVPEQPELEDGQVEAGVTPQLNADPAGHPGEDGQTVSPNTGEQETAASFSAGGSGETLQGSDLGAM